MKFSPLVVVLLGRPLPVLTRRPGFALPMTRNGVSRHGTTWMKDATPHRQWMVESDDEGRHLRYTGRSIQKASRKLRSTPQVLKTVIPCNPRSSDADIGILSCGKDHICEPSTRSPLGGVCIASKDSNNQDQGET